MESILTSIKKMLGPSQEYDPFDPDIITHINSVFADLNQIGVGPEEGFRIEDDTTVWTDYLQDDLKLESVKSYMYLRTKLVFDPPLNASVIEAMQRDIDKWEWRLSIAAETK